MRNLIIWTLSFLLVFEPTVWAANRPTLSEMKAIIEYSEISKRSMTLNELYGRAYGLMPKSVRDQIEPMLDVYGDYEIPKFNVTKAKNASGEEYYQLSAVQDGKAVTISLGESSKALVKVNGQVVDGNMWNMKGMLSKAGVSKNDLKNVPEMKRKPAQVYILNAKQIDRLSRDQKKAYYKQLRELLQSMEAVGQVQMKAEKKTSSRAPASLEMFAALMMGESAVAARPAGPCVAAGHVTQINGTCGRGPDGNVLSELRGECGVKQFQCNTVVYGPTGGCVNAGPDSTAQCNANVAAGDDIPDLNKDNREAYERLRVDAMAQADAVSETCRISREGSLAKDQTKTCDAFKKREDVMKAWDCGREEFKGKYPKLCAEPGAPTQPADPGDQPPGPPALDPVTGEPIITPPGGPGGPAGPGGPGGTDNGITCDALPDNMSLEKDRVCLGGGTQNSSCWNKVSQKAQTAYLCECGDGSPVLKGYKCADTGKVDKDRDGKKDRKDKKKKKGPNWLLIAGAGLLGLLAFHWLTKKAVKQQYDNIDPLPQATPVPVDPVAPPGAR